ncbi:MAG: Hydrolase of the alpha/beta superfamily [Bacillales bacterium]|nr:Hydrolase of the alpha/beta superfamily [Bacillales bacterium]
MIQITKHSLAGIPTLCLHKKHAENAPSSQPAVIILHGITNQKEDNLTYAYLLAEKGFRVFLPDAIHHGDRKNGMNKDEQSFHFWKIVLNSIQELGELKDIAIRDFHVDPSRIYVGGISMGAITTFGALTQHNWIKGAFSMMGNPSFVKLAREIYNHLDDDTKSNMKPFEFYKEMLAPYDLTLQPQKVNGRSLFVWHGDADESVSISGVRNFVENFQESGFQGEIVMKVEQGRGHKVSNFGYHAMIEWLCLQENI